MCVVADTDRHQRIDRHPGAFHGLRAGRRFHGGRDDAVRIGSVAEHSVAGAVGSAYQGIGAGDEVVVEDYRAGDGRRTGMQSGESLLMCRGQSGEEVGRMRGIGDGKAELDRFRTVTPAEQALGSGTRGGGFPNRRGGGIIREGRLVGDGAQFGVECAEYREFTSCGAHEICGTAYDPITDNEQPCPPASSGTPASANHPARRTATL